MGIVRFALRFPHTFYVVAALILFAMVQAGISIADTLLMVAVSSVGAAWLAWKALRPSPPPAEYNIGHKLDLDVF